MEALFPYRPASMLPLISRHVRGLKVRMNRLSAGQDRVFHALKSEPPLGVSRIDWIARQLNGE